MGTLGGLTRTYVRRPMLKYSFTYTNAYSRLSEADTSTCEREKEIEGDRPEAICECVRSAGFTIA